MKPVSFFSRLRRSFLGLAVAGAALFALAAPAFAQVSPTSTGTLTSVPTGAATNDVVTVTSSAVDVPQGRALAFIPEFKLAGAGTGNVIFTAQVSIDGTNWTTSSGLTHTIAANGTTVVRSYWYLDPSKLGAVAKIRLAQISNAANAQVLTNVLVSWSKASAPP